MYPTATDNVPDDDPNGHPDGECRSCTEVV
jgi:hypothetical protein